MTDPSGIDWDSQIQLDEAGDDIAPPDHDWLAHEAGYPDDEHDAIEAELLADEEPSDADR
jgi:hypothetical protein